MVDFFTGSRHCTRYGGSISAILDITASIVQGSVCPSSYIINAADLSAVTPGNRIHKYADDTYIVIPVRNVQSRQGQAELDHVEQWAHCNNLALNRGKSLEIVLTGRRRNARECNLPVLPGISRVTTITMLAVTISNRLSVTVHVSNVISKCAQSLYAMKVLRCHGMCKDALKIIFESVVVAKIL